MIKVNVAVVHSVREERWLPVKGVVPGAVEQEEPMEEGWWALAVE